uniref:G-patch domain-containing protein n=1 Tax=Anopheles atroparvus TaxID=41427 RepID=A0AAG5CZM7_ANOAO
MPRVNFSRTERFAQMSKQEQLIAQKRQQILEKQRTLELAKQIAAEATKDTPSSIAEAPEAPEAAGKVVLPFSNDGSFLERFKQLSEKIVKQTEDQVKPPLEEPDAAVSTEPVPSVGVSASTSGEQMFKFDVPPPSLLPTLPPPPPPPPPQLPAMADEVHFEPFYDLPPVGSGSPLADGMEEAGRHEAGTAGEVEANFQVFSEHDKLPTTVEELIQLVADIGDVYEDKLCSRKNDLHPSLWFIFDKQSEAYRSYRRMIDGQRQSMGRSEDLGAASGAFSSNGRKLSGGDGAGSGSAIMAEDDDDDTKYDPADVLDDSIIDETNEDTFRPQPLRKDYREGPRGGAEGTATVGGPVGEPGAEIPIHMMPNFYGDERHFYDDKSTTETDSDTEYVREARERNLKNLKRKTFDAGNRREDGSSTDSDDDYHGGLGDSANESLNEKNGGSSGAGGSATGGSGGGGSRGHRQKFRKKSRWGENTDAGTGTAGSQEGGQQQGGGPSTSGGVPAASFAGPSRDGAGPPPPAPWSVNIGKVMNVITTQPPPPPPPPPPALAPATDRSSPGLLQYVFRHYGTVAEVSAECWNKAQEHYRLQLLFDDLTAKIQQHERFVRDGPTRASEQQRAAGRDSDEERRLNTAKLEAIMCWINEITRLYERVRPGHLSEFLMRDDYERFVEQFRRTSDRQPNFEDYKQFRLREANGTAIPPGTGGPGSQSGGPRRPEYSSTDSDFVSYQDQPPPSALQSQQQQQQQQQQRQSGQGETGGRGGSGGGEVGQSRAGHEPSSSTVGGEKRTAEEAELHQQQLAAKRRKSRWGGQVEGGGPQFVAGQSPLLLTHPPGPPPPLPPSKAPPAKLCAVSRTDPALLAYARQNFGTTNLSEEDWKKAEDHYKINLLYQDMLRKRQEIDRLANSGRFKYEYDSDEDTTGGTWEHKLRQQEMEATQKWANELTRQSEGKHHIGDFLPPEELRKFMEKYEAQKNNRQPNLSDYKDYKLREDNVGFQMLQKLGWKQGQGLGADGSGIVDPINKAAQRDNNQGLGIITPDNPEVNDNEYDAYRKRMMLAYRFRPNPLNNPRRAYY